MMAARGTIYVVDDEPEINALLVDHLSLMGYTLRSFPDGVDCLRHLNDPDRREDEPDLIITDLRMPELGGLDLIRHVHIHRPRLPVMLMTAFASMESAIEGLRRGAFDYLTKPFKLAEITHVVERAITFGRLQRQNLVLGNELKGICATKALLGRSAVITELSRTIDRISFSESNVLVRGDSGTGKEVVARAIHERSARATGPFVVVNCAAIPEDLLESELFGHVRGAFTGATSSRTGLFIEAARGTLFLDEVAELTLSMQAKLLRVLQERVVRPLGQTREVPLQARLIAATHRDLEDDVRRNVFREDLYYRLAVIPVVLPRLRDRPEDIPLLVSHFIDRFSPLNGGRVVGCSPAALRKLVRYHWPGNVRELENVIERMVVLSEGPMLEEAAVPVRESSPVDLVFEDLARDWPTLEHLIHRYMLSVLRRTGHRRELAARILGISRRTLYRHLTDVTRDKTARP